MRRGGGRVGFGGRGHVDHAAPRPLRELRCCAHELRDVALLAARASRSTVAATAAAAAVWWISPRGLPPVDGGGEPAGVARVLAMAVHRCLLWCSPAIASVLLLPLSAHLELLQLGRERGYSACCPVAETVVALTWRSRVVRRARAPVATLGAARTASGHRATASGKVAPSGGGSAQCAAAPAPPSLGGDARALPVDNHRSKIPRDGGAGGTYTG